MKTFFKLSLLSLILIVNAASASNRSQVRADVLGGNASKSEVAMNLNTAVSFGVMTGGVSGFVGAIVHAGALQSGANPGTAALLALAGGGATGATMSIARSEVIKDLLGSEYKAVGVIGGVGGVTMVGGLYWLLFGGPASAARAAEIAKKRGAN